MENRNVLMIDDDLHVLDPLARALERKGFAVTRATCPKEAFERMNKEIGTIVTDFSFETGDGAEMIVGLNTAYPEVPIVIITALKHRIPPHIVEIAEEVLMKPFRCNSLLETVKKTLHLMGRTLLVPGK